MAQKKDRISKQKNISPRKLRSEIKELRALKDVLERGLSEERALLVATNRELATRKAKIVQLQQELVAQTTSATARSEIAQTVVAMFAEANTPQLFIRRFTEVALAMGFNPAQLREEALHIIQMGFSHGIKTLVAERERPRSGSHPVEAFFREFVGI